MLEASLAMSRSYTPKVSAFGPRLLGSAISSEAEYQRLLIRAASRLSRSGIWFRAGAPIADKYSFIIPDVIAEGIVEDAILNLCVIELKFNNRCKQSQPAHYSEVLGIPLYCVVDGFRRSPVVWKKSSHFDLLSYRRKLLALKLAGKIGRFIEDFNDQHFL